MNKIIDTYEKYREPLLYVIVGGLTTAVNFVAYFLCSRKLGISPFISNGVGWVCSVTFAYFTDKIVVFRSKNFGWLNILTEAAAFVAARLATGFMDMGLFFLLNTLMGLNDFWVKVFINVLVVVGNYLFSKFVIFKKPKTN